MTSPTAVTGPHAMPVTYESPESFAVDEAQRAKTYWGSAGVQAGYLNPTRWSRHMANRVVNLAPRRAFEFGCNCGRNLEAIRDSDPSIELLGVDVNHDAVRHGIQAHGLDLRVGDETSLRSFPDRHFEVVFTISVLDHIPDPRPALSELIRVAGKALLLLEPWSTTPAKAVELDARSGAPTADSYLYFWDYPRLFAELAPGATLSSYGYDLGGSGMKRWLSSRYWFFTLERDPSVA